MMFDRVGNGEATPPSADSAAESDLTLALMTKVSSDQYGLLLRGTEYRGSNTVVVSLSFGTGSEGHRCVLRWAVDAIEVIWKPDSTNRGSSRGLLFLPMLDISNIPTSSSLLRSFTGRCFCFRIGKDGKECKYCGCCIPWPVRQCCITVHGLFYCVLH